MNFARANENGIAQIVINTVFGEIDFCETTVFACANEIGNTQTVKNTISGKMHFFKIVIFACANEIDIAQNLVFLCFCVSQGQKHPKCFIFLTC